MQMLTLLFCPPLMPLTPHPPILVFTDSCRPISTIPHVYLSSKIQETEKKLKPLSFHLRTYEKKNTT